MKFFRNHIPFLIAVIITCTGLYAYLSDDSLITEFLNTLSLKTIDLRFHYREKVPHGNTITIAAIDEKSLYAEGRWPWPRTRIASLIQKASDAGARVIAFDIGFFEEDDRRVLETLKTLRETIKTDPNGIKRIDTLLNQSDSDKRLAETIKNTSVKVVLGYYFNLDQTTHVYQSDDELQAQEDNISSSEHTLVQFSSSDAESNAGFITALSPEANINILSRSADYSGFFNMLSDSDGIVRAMPVIIRYNQRLYAPLSLMAVSAYTGSPVSVFVDSENAKTISIGSHTIPTDRNGRVIINYRGGPQTYPRLSVTDILNDRTDPSDLNDKIVIVGATAAGLSDIRATPFSNVSPGCEIHANIIDSILSDDLLYHPPLYEMWSILAIVLAGIGIGSILPMTGAINGFILFITSGALYWWLCQYLFSKTGLILNMTIPLTVLSLSYITITTFKYLSESRKKKFINDAFSTYLAPSVVKQLISSPETLVLGGEDRDITAFFSDVQGFTSISEKLTPKELVDLLNEFLTEMTDIILSYEGTVDKFEGDAIIAFFGAPNTLDNHARTTCSACIDMQDRLKEMNRIWKQSGKPQLKMRIGLCSGTAVVGNMGSKNRMDYTMMGDVVNTAARLEGVNKHYGSYTMISETTRNMAGPEIVTREIDTIYLVGKNEPVTIFQIIGRQESIDSSMEHLVHCYEKGLGCYKSMDWNNAIHWFTKALDAEPEDGPSNTMLKRCTEFMRTPPDKKWNGVFRITSK